MNLTNRQIRWTIESASGSFGGPSYFEASESPRRLFLLTPSPSFTDHGARRTEGSLYDGLEVVMPPCADSEALLRPPHSGVNGELAAADVEGTIGMIQGGE